MVIASLFINVAWSFLPARLVMVDSMVSWTAYSAGSFVAMVLVVAGAAKLGNRREFSQTVQNYKVVSPRTSRVIGIVLPEVELLVGCLLLIKIGVAFAGAVACVLFALFATAISVNLVRGRRRIACGCFGPSENRPLGWSHVVQNVALAIVSLLSAYHMSLAQRSRFLWQSQLAATLAAAVILISWWLVTLSSRLLRSAA